MDLRGISHTPVSPLPSVLGSEVMVTVEIVRITCSSSRIEPAGIDRPGTEAFLVNEHDFYTEPV